jgi:hypothetical protein
MPVSWAWAKWSTRLSTASKRRVWLKVAIKHWISQNIFSRRKSSERPTHNYDYHNGDYVGQRAAAYSAKAIYQHKHGIAVQSRGRALQGLLQKCETQSDC